MRLLVVMYDKHPYNKEIVQCVHSIEAGHTFSESLQRVFPKIHPVTLAMLQVGEVHGSVQDILSLTAQYISEQKKIRQSILMASLYPCILIVAMGSLIGFLVLYIFPKILPVLIGMKITLPLLTRILIFIVGGIQRFWYMGIFGAVLILVCSVFFMRHTKIRHIVDRVIFKIPEFRHLIVLKNTILIFRTLAIFLETDARIDNALKNAQVMTSQKQYVVMLTEAIEQTSRGKTFSDIVRQFKFLFIPEAGELILIGERGGMLPQMCGRIADRASEQLTKKINIVLKLAEPLVMLLLGCVVALVALAFMLPLYSVTSNISTTP
ncbi:MAG: type II secretion system F family protein [Candidatus Taylorbacteria bacterium]|nr:type II secretion system F family protein [Candidatus Taylorbacteria bacterium]